MGWLRALGTRSAVVVDATHLIKCRPLICAVSPRSVCMTTSAMSLSWYVCNDFVWPASVGLYGLTLQWGNMYGLTLQSGIPPLDLRTRVIWADQIQVCTQVSYKWSGQCNSRWCYIMHFCQILKYFFGHIWGFYSDLPPHSAVCFGHIWVWGSL